MTGHTTTGSADTLFYSGVKWWIRLNPSRYHITTEWQKRVESPRLRDGSSFPLILNKEGRKQSHHDDGARCRPLLPQSHSQYISQYISQYQCWELGGFWGSGPSLRHRQEIPSGDEGVRGQTDLEESQSGGFIYRQQWQIRLPQWK